MAHSVEMEEAKQVLARAMLASITGNRPPVSTAEVSDLLISSLELSEGDFTVHEHHPEDFLILFSSHTTKCRLDGDTSSTRRASPSHSGHGASSPTPALACSNAALS